MKSIYTVMSLVLFMSFTMSCSLDGDLNSPNDVSTADPNADLLMNKAQADFALFFAKVSGNENIQSRGMNQFVRFKAMQGDQAYSRAYRPQDFDEIWRDSYQRVLVNLETMIPVAVEKQLNVHVGISLQNLGYTHVHI